MKPCAGVPGERRILVEQERMRRQDRGEILRPVDLLAHLGQQPYPEQRQRLVVFPGVPDACGERADRVTHPDAGVVGRARFLQERPRHPEMLAMMKIRIAYFTALEAPGKFAIGDFIAGCRFHRYYDIVISESGQ